jgi:hypothetical protein
MRYVTTPALLALYASFVSSLALAQTSSDPGYSGWGQAGSNSLYAGASFLNGQRPDEAKSGPERYQRIQGWLCYQLYGYYDKTRFDTLVGGEISAGFGYVTPESANPGRSPEPSDNWTRVHFRSEGAFDYALVHWSGAVAGRVVFGAGGGFEFGSSWYNRHSQAYPLILGRIQLFFGGSTGLHLAYHFIPITTDKWRDQEQSGEVLLSLRWFQLGAQVQYVRVVDALPQILAITNIGGVIGLLF